MSHSAGEPAIEMTRILCVSVTASGASLARRLPFEHVHGSLVRTVFERWAGLDAVVIVAATGIAVRAIAPLLGRKADDPAVVVVDDRGEHVIALLGGHARRANELTRWIASVIGAQPVVTTGTDVARMPALDLLPGLQASGDIASVMRRWLDGEELHISASSGLERWPIPAALTEAGALVVALPWSGDTDPAPVAVITDSTTPPRPGLVELRPLSLVVGVGASSGADPGRLASLLQTCLGDASLHPDSIGVIATLDRKIGEPAIVALATAFNAPLHGFPSQVLAGVDVPTPSSVVADAVGTRSVAEAAALIAAGPGSVLVVTKRISIDSTIAIARRERPVGHLAVVGLGPGAARHRSPAATAAVRHAEVVIGFEGYIEQTADLLSASQTVLRSPLGSEQKRCTEALRRAAAGSQVALVCSGDAGVYAMASLVCELAPAHGDPPLTVVPGITAAVAAAAVLGAPLGHDHCSISLSDLLTPWSVIVERVEAAAAGDFVVSFYNPRSSRRHHQLDDALMILLGSRGADTPAAVITDVARQGEEIIRTTLGRLQPETVGMLSLVIIGASTTRWIGERMITPRGYLPAGSDVREASSDGLG